MSWRIVVILVITGSSVPSIQTKEYRDENGPQTFVHEGDGLFEALTVETNNHYNTGPKDMNTYGSMTKLENNAFMSASSHQSSSTQTRTVTSRGGPEHEEVSYVIFNDSNHQGQPKQNWTIIKGPESVWSSNTIHTVNNFDSAPGREINYGYTEETKQVYKSQTGNNQTLPIKTGLTFKSISSNRNSNASESIEINAESRTINEGNVFNLEKNSLTGNVTENTKEINIQNDKKKEAKIMKLNKSNGQTSLSSNVCYAFLYIFVMLLKNHAY